jgi:hypothetical protein
MDRHQLATHLRRAIDLGAEPLELDTGDRSVPVAREWLRRWAPRAFVLPLPACTCAAGRCATCN